LLAVRDTSEWKMEINKYIGREWPDIEVFPIWSDLWVE
jgi:hypothetical protein